MRDEDAFRRKRGGESPTRAAADRLGGETRPLERRALARSESEYRTPEESHGRRTEGGRHITKKRKQHKATIIAMGTCVIRRKLGCQKIWKGTLLLKSFFNGLESMSLKNHVFVRWRFIIYSIIVTGNRFVLSAAFVILYRVFFGFDIAKSC